MCIRDRHKADAQAMWKTVKLVTGSKDQSNNKNIHNITATQLNAHYAKISHDPAYITPVEKRTASVNKRHFEEQEIHKAISDLKKTATGPDNLPYWILKLSAHFLCKPLTHLINKSLHNSYMPTQWKTATITPVPKVPSPKNPAEYRPISLTSILS